jgi:hypothetical protein
MVFNNADPQRIAIQLQNAIATNKSPKRLFYEFLSNGSMEGNFLANKILENKQLLRIITSKRGRAWIKTNIDDFLNYLEEISK